VPEARRLLNGARGDITRLKAVLSRRKQTLEASLNVLPEYRQALAERNRAKAAYEAARRPALLNAKSSDAYAAARKRLLDARSAVAAATRTARHGGGGAIAAMTRDVREAEGALKQAEAEIVLADPVAAEASAALDAAEARLAALRKERVDDVLESDPTAQSARLNLVSAEARQAAADALLARLRAADEEGDVYVASAGTGSRGSGAPSVGGPRIYRPQIPVADYARGKSRGSAGKACIGGA
jgi:hypothetical protein